MPLSIAPDNTCQGLGQILRHLRKRGIILMLVNMVLMLIVLGTMAKLSSFFSAVPARSLSTTDFLVRGLIIMVTLVLGAFCCWHLTNRTAHGFSLAAHSNNFLRHDSWDYLTRTYPITAIAILEAACFIPGLPPTRLAKVLAPLLTHSDKEIRLGTLSACSEPKKRHSVRHLFNMTPQEIAFVGGLK